MYNICYIKRTLFRSLFICLAIFGMIITNISHSLPASATACEDVQFIFARGSGEALSGPSYTAWRDHIIEKLGVTTLRYRFYELGSQTINGYQYPAVSVGSDLSGVGNLVGAAISGGSAFEFGRSVEQGSGELEAYLSRTSALCPRTRYVLGGYSQGAMVVSRTLSQLDHNKIIYATTFGDPKLYLPEGNSHFLDVLPKIPEACYGKNLSNYRLHVPDCYAYEGILGSYQPYQPDDYVDKLGTWCNEYDIMCSSGVSLSDHTSYVSSDLYNDAARVIVEKVKPAFLQRNFSRPDPATTNLAEVAILIDSTKSMSKLIDSYKAEAQRLAAQVVEHHGHVALYEFRDLIDGFQPKQHCDFTCTLAEFSDGLDRIEVYGGGDRPESVLSASLTAMNELRWSPGATKSIIILTDAYYLNPDRDGTTLDQVVQRSLEIDPVNFYVLTNRQDAAESFQPLTEGTNGRIFDLDTELELSTQTILTRPVARLSLSNYFGTTDTPVVFDASRSYTTDGAELHYDWDLDGDGTFEALDQGPRITHQYSAPTQHYLRVKVYTSPDNFSTMSAQVTIRSTDHLQPAEIAQATVDQVAPGSFELTFQANADRVLLLLDDALQGFIPLASGTGKITIRDIVGSATVSLVPYRDNLRGHARRLEINSAIPKVPNTASAALLDNPPFPPDDWGKFTNVLAYRQYVN